MFFNFDSVNLHGKHKHLFLNVLWTIFNPFILWNHRNTSWQAPCRSLVQPLIQSGAVTSLVQASSTSGWATKSTVGGDFHHLHGLPVPVVLHHTPVEKLFPLSDMNFSRWGLWLLQHLPLPSGVLALLFCFKCLQAAIRLPLTSSLLNKLRPLNLSSSALYFRLACLDNPPLHPLQSLSIPLDLEWPRCPAWPHQRWAQGVSVCRPCSSRCSPVRILLYSRWERATCFHSPWCPP